MRRAFILPFLFALAPHLCAQAPTRDDAKALVVEAVSSFSKGGKDKFLYDVNSPKGPFHFMAGQRKGLYIFVYDEKGVVVAHGARLELIGVNRWDVKDPAGKPYVRDWTDMLHSKGSGWIDYLEHNPAAGNKIMPKSSYVVLKDGLVIGCGIYQ